MVKLADFGIAKAAEQSDITKVGSVLGTAAYLSPEQARGEPAGPASDLYALGVVSYQLLAGRLPYEAASLTDLARLQETGAAAAAATSSSRDVPPALAAAVVAARCTATPSAATPTPPTWSRRCATACAARAPRAGPTRRAAMPRTRTRRGCSPTGTTTRPAHPRPRRAG